MLRAQNKILFAFCCHIDLGLVLIKFTCLNKQKFFAIKANALSFQASIFMLVALFSLVSLAIILA